MTLPGEALPRPDQRVQCVTCGRWPMASNWPNHMQSQHGPHWPADPPFWRVYAERVAAALAAPVAGELDEDLLRKALIQTGIYVDEGHFSLPNPGPLAALIIREYAALAASQPVAETVITNTMTWPDGSETLDEFRLGQPVAEEGE